MGDPMEQKAPIVAGLGGAALVAAVLSFGGHSAQSDTEKQSANAAVTDKHSSTAAAFTANQAGPWYAFCQEYATTQFDHGKDPSAEWGVSGHHVPEEADEGTVEITRSIPYAGSKRLETETFNVRKHTVGDLTGCVPDGAKLRIVIAIVPDPNATQMPPEFDRDIEAIQAAASAEHYNYTRFWFPWRMNESIADKPTDSEGEARRREEPGILCFRSAVGQERLFVLLVGETPTSGVNRLQLSHAFYYRQRFAKGQISDSDQDKLLIAGPHFSASFPAIQDVLDQGLYWEGEKPPKDSLPLTPIRSATFISPDASGPWFIDAFRRFCKTPQPRCSLETLSLSAEEAGSIAISYLESLGYDRERIAQLSEDESAFGGGELHPLPAQERPLYGLSLFFPRDLSSVRSLSDAESAKVADSSSKYIGASNPLPPIQLTVRDPIDSDSPPAFGREQETALVARSLEDTVQQMRTHRIRAVVISASNPLDSIYLLEYLHNQLPNVRTVTFGADELLLDRPHFVDLTGTIAVTTLPTLPGVVNVIRHSPAGWPVSLSRGRQETEFPMPSKSSRQEGELLAMEMLLDPKLNPDDEASQWTDPKRCYPISVAGENGFLLIADGPQRSDDEDPTFPCLSASHATLPSDNGTLPLDGAQLLPAYYTKVPGSRHGPGYFMSFMCFLGALSCVHFFSLAQSQRHREGIFSYPHSLKGNLESRRLYLLFVINNQLLLLDLLGARVGWAVLGLNPSGGQPWLRIIFILLILSIVTIALLQIEFVKRFVGQIRAQGKDRKETGHLMGNIVIASTYLIWTAWMIWRLPAFQRQSGVLLERVPHLNEGLSPVMPITAIILGYSLWSWMQLKRLDWAASRRVDLTLDKMTYLGERVGEVMRETDNLLPQPIVQLASLGVVVVAAVSLWNSLNGFDGFSFHLWIVIWGFCMLLVTVVSSCLHARCIWNKLQKLLEYLETTTMREAFQKIGSSGELSIKIWDLARFGRSFAVFNRTVESISDIYGATSQEALDAKAKLAIIVNADAQGKQVGTGATDELSSALNIDVPNAVKAMGAAKAPDQYQSELQLYLALRLIAFIRYTMLHIGTLVAFVAYGYVVAVLSIMFYAFEGRKTLGNLSLFTFLVLLIWIGVMMVQFQRNGMLSRLEGSAPGEASYLQVALHLLTVGGLPLVAIVTTQFPAIGNFVLLMFRPLLGTLH
jgi:hypothetical protein